MSLPLILRISRSRILSGSPLLAILLSISACDKAADLLGIEDSRKYPPTLSGRVIDSDSSAVTGAHVQVLGSGKSAKTDQRGGFLLAGLSPGEIRLGILKFGFQDTLLTSNLPSGLAEPQGLGFLTLPRLFTTLSGSLSTGASGSVALEDHSVAAQTDIRGEFRIAGAAPGTYRVMAVGRDGTCGSKEIQASLGGNLNIGVIGMEHACGSVVGRVIDEQGKPLAAATIRAFEGMLTTTTDGAGRFRLDGIPPGPRIAVRVSSPEAVLRIYGVRVGADRTTNLGTLSAGSRVSGRPWIVPGLLSIHPSDSVAILVADTVLLDSTFRLRRFAWSLDAGVTWDSTRENRFRLSRSRFAALADLHPVLVQGISLDGRSTPVARIALDFQPALDLDPPILTRVAPSKDTTVRWKDSVLVASWATSDPSGMATATIGDSLVKIIGSKAQRHLVLAVGRTIVRLRARDSAGNWAFDSLILTRSEKDTTPPLFRRLGPLGDTAVRWKDSLIFASWAASDSSGILAASIQGTAVPSSSGRFSRSVIVPVGTSHVVFRVRDSAGALARDSIKIVRSPPDRSAPTILRLAPTRDTILVWKDSSMLVAWEASDVSGIGQATMGDSTFPAGSVRFSRRISFPVGTSILRFAVRDSIGWTAMDSIRIVRTRFDTSAPSLRMANPTRDTTVRWKDSLLTVVWEADDVNGIRAASINDSLIQPVRGRLTRTLLVPVGFSSIRIRARDSAGYLAIDSLRVLRANPDRTPPTLTPITPSRDTSLRWRDSVIILAWSAEDVSGIASASIGDTTLAPSEGRFALKVVLPVGSSTFRFQAQDSVGLSAIDSVRIERRTRDTVPPILERIQPIGANSVVRFGDSTIVLEWRVEDTRGLDSVQVDGIAMVPGPDGRVRSKRLLRYGVNKISIQAWDLEGNLSRDSLSVERLSRDEVPPSITRLAPLGDTTMRWIDSTLQLRWSVSDNDSLATLFLGDERLPPGGGNLVAKVATLRVGDSLLVLSVVDRDGNWAFDTIRTSRAPQDTSRLEVVLPHEKDTLRLDDTIRVSSNGPVEYAITTGLWLPFPVDGLVLPRSCTLSVRTRTPNEVPRTWERALFLDTWNPARVYDTIVDARDGRAYRIITIGSQTWMAENLAYRGPPGATTFVGTCPSGSAEACQVYGRLYTWAEVMAKSTASSKVPSGVQGLCPTGWHVPSDSEWTILVDRGLASARPGTALRSQGGWRQGNGNDSVGFHAVAAGHRFLTGVYYQEGEQGYWWTTSMAADTASAWSRRLYGGFEGVYRNYYNKGYGLSLRCLRNP